MNEKWSFWEQLPLAELGSFHTSAIYKPGKGHFLSRRHSLLVCKIEIVILGLVMRLNEVRLHVCFSSPGC